MGDCLNAGAEGHRLWAWGFNGWGQLGDGSSRHRATPGLISGLAGITSVAAGADHCLAAATDGRVWAWGHNRTGQLGTGDLASRSVPVAVGGRLPPVRTVTAGYVHSLAIATDGTAWAWGHNGAGQLGTGRFDNCPVPARVTCESGEPLNGVSVLTGGRGHSLAVLADGSVRAWGYNGQKQLGIPEWAGSFSPYPVPVMRNTDSQLTGVRAVACGASHSLALMEDGTVWEWGLSPARALAPTGPGPVAGIGRAVAVAGGENHSMALDADGFVWVWGANWLGQLGNSRTAPEWAPVRVPGLSECICIASGLNHSLAVQSDGMVWAWGGNGYGAAGQQLPLTVGGPVQVPGLTRILAVAAGGDHSLGLN